MKDKVYVLIQDNYNLLASEIGASNLIGVFKSKENAINELRKHIDTDIKEYEWVVDSECDVEEFIKTLNGCIRLFHKYQENWDYHLEYRIEESEV